MTVLKSKRSKEHRVKGAHLLYGGLLLSVTCMLLQAASAQVIEKDPATYKEGGNARISAAQPTENQIAQAQTVEFDIPAQPLTTALTAFGDQADMQVAVDTAILDGLNAEAVNGNMLPEEALARLLAGSGITWRYADPKTFLLMAKTEQESGETVLDPVQVVGRSESAFGPVEGYVAQRSATGTKTDTPLIETPRSISVVTADQIEAQALDGIGGVNEALRYTPGVVAEPRGLTPERSEIYIRGFENEDSIYRDGMKGHSLNFLSFAVTTVDTYGTERVELLRGPSSGLYGAGQTGGLVNLVTKRPTAEAFQEVVVEAGTYQQYGVKFDVGGAVNEDEKVLFRLTGVARDGETQIDFTETARFYIAPAVTLNLAEETSLTVLAQYQWDDAYGTNFVPASGTVVANPNGEIPNTRFTGDPAFDVNESRYLALGYVLDHEFNDNVRINHKARYEHFDFDGAALFANSGLQADNRTANRLSFVDNSNGYFVTTDTNGQFDFALGGTKNTMAIGVDYKNARHDRAFTGGAGPTLDVFNPVYFQAVPDVSSAFQGDTRTDLYQVGLYVQNQTKIADRVILTYGGRQDWASSDVDNRLTGAVTEKRDDAFTAQAGVTYLFDNGVAPYASYVESFEPQSGTDFGGTPFEPTTGTQYEAGLKFQPTGYNALATAAVYELTRQNVLTSDPVNAGFSVQTGEIQSRGFEFEAKANLFESVDLSLGYAYTEAEVTASNAADLGKTPVLIPEHAASAFASYTVPQGVLEGFRFGAGVRYVGESFGNTANTIVVPSFTLVDAAISYEIKGGRFSGLRLALNANNLFDKSYISGCENANACYFGEARMVKGTLKYRW